MNDKVWQIEVDSEQYLKVRGHLINFFGIGDNEIGYISMRNIPAPKTLSIYTHRENNIRDIFFLFTDDKHIEKLLDPISEESFYDIVWTMLFVGHWLLILEATSIQYEDDPEVLYHKKIYKELLALYKLCYGTPYEKFSNNPVKISILGNDHYNIIESFDNFDNHILRCAIGEYCKKHLPNIKSVKDANNALRLMQQSGRKQTSPYAFAVIYGTYSLLKALTQDKKVASIAICKVIGRYLVYLGLVSEDYTDQENICGLIKYLLKQDIKPSLPKMRPTDLEKPLDIYSDIY